MEKPRYITIRVTSEEYASLLERIRNTGLRMQQYGHDMLFGRIPQELPKKDFLEVLGSLRRIELEISRIAFGLEETGSLDADLYRRDAEDLQAEISRIKENAREEPE